MLDVAVVTLFPEMLREFQRHGVLSRAVAKGLLTVHCINPRDYAEDVHRTVDDRPYGGGPGMVMKVGPLQSAIIAAKAKLGGETEAKPLTVYMSPQGKPFSQSMAREWAQRRRPLVFLAGRYEGVDERLLEQQVDCEVSLGDFVLSGGEVSVMAMLDAVTRLLPGALGNSESALEDSFGVDGLLDHPHYTRPEQLDGQSVPEVLLSGDHRRIAQWRRKQALLRTWRRRPDLLAAREQSNGLSEPDRALLRELGYLDD